MPTETTTKALSIYALPGGSVFPESVGLDPSTGDAYVGSLADGALYRLPAGGEAPELWSGAGADGRGSVVGVKVDARGRLWAAGGYDGSLSVYDLDGGGLLARLDVGSRPSCVNDIAFAANGDAYITDSFVPTLFRVGADSLEFERWIDLAEQGVPWADGLNFNGIVLAPDGRHVVACQTNLGRFWRAELAGAAVEEVALDGGPLEHCDGLAIDGSTLYVAVNARNVVAVVELAADGSGGRVVTLLSSEDFAFPTALAVTGERLLVVNAQLDKMETEPELPFSVVAIPAPRR
jgi:Cu-Zn family superoxide dismutase